MKKVALLTITTFALIGCSTDKQGMINMLRPIAENKSANIEVTAPNLHVTIQTRVVGDTNNSPLTPLRSSQDPK